ncbi:4-(cytidine 5'-diphospho)-2-C-methyl-D-erythritol kinase [Dendrosporobacter sp. 1207_IL3150]|uniref:4-(cytidine 5'-diphospho)-2-C-methyl-D-erythritol kinase n=1 Tax=Dendrosporobacter sp. 1207_IL3150 TaxID=3084054 RepID=UPI002FD9B296
MLTVYANAKINLTLDVLNKRPDGYHEVEMVMQEVDLADHLTFREQKEGITVCTNIPDLACDNTNLAYKAAHLIKTIYNIEQGIQIDLNKRIPMAAGLAGGSTDAAGVLIGLNKLWHLGISLDELSRLGALLGSDVPFCLNGGTMLATGRGEVLERLSNMPACNVILAKPAVSVSTAWVYKNYRSSAVSAHPDTAGIIKCLEADDLDGIASRLCNTLETVTIPVHPEIGRLKALMCEYGAMASLMSGSGPTVFGLTPDTERANYIAAKLEKLSDAQIIVAKTVAKSGGE